MRYTPQQKSELGLRWRRRLRRAAVMAGGVLAVGVVVAACGGGPSTPGVATGSTTTTASPSAGGSTQRAGLLAYSSCMRSHGVPNFPDPTSSGGIPKQGVVSALQAVSKSQVTAAQTACQHLLPAGGLSGQTVQPITAQDQQYYLNAVACMRAHGITNFPDPVFSGGGVSFSIGHSGIDTNSPQFIQANQTCRKLIPAGLPDSGSGG
jgi:hypothetical protein